LTAELREFKAYNAEETKGILKQRLGYAFVPNCWEDDAFELAATKAAELSDIRSGLYILKESGLAAEAESSKKITIEHVKKAIQKLDEYHIKKSTDLEDEPKQILDLIKTNSNKKMGDLFNLYIASGGSLSYKSFTRRIEKLEKDKFITVTKTQGGEEGNISIIKYNSTKKLTEF
jgi:cell division control protein 6